MKYNLERWKLNKFISNRIEKVFDIIGIDYEVIADEIRCACPVHMGDNKTAFVHRKDHGKWSCYTKNCHKSGNDAINLLILILRNENVDTNYRHAIEWCINNLGLITDKIENSESSAEDYALVQMNREIRADQELNELVNNNDQTIDAIPIEKIGDIEPAKYFLDFGFDPKILKRFYVGFCKDRNKPMYRRAFAPLLDEEQKHVIGVTGRITLESCKYCGEIHEHNRPCKLDDPSTFVYPKWKHFGFQRKKEIYNWWNLKGLDTILIVESPKDVWWLTQHGIENSGCILGSSISDDHLVKLLKNNVRKVMLGLNTDEAGKRGTDDAVKKLKNYIDVKDISYLIEQGKSDFAECDSNFMINNIVPKIKEYE